MSTMKKRGISTIVTHLLFVMLLIVAIVAFWGIYRSVISVDENYFSDYLKSLNLKGEDEFTTRNIPQTLEIDMSNYTSQEPGKELPIIWKKEIEEIKNNTSKKSYIIQFTKKPVLEKKVELEKQGLKRESVDKEVKEYSKDLKNENEKIKEEILSKVPGKKENIGNEFTNVFNGLSMILSDEEVKEIEKISKVKRIYPDLEVHALLMDSVPLINADDVWQLDANLNACGGGQPASSYRVFVTSQVYKGNLGGLDGADAKCQQLADSAGLNGKWMAYLGNTTIRPFKRIFGSAVPYKLINDAVIADNWNDLTDGSIQNQIDKDENGQIIPPRTSVYAWTAKNAGDARSTCLEWTSNNNWNSGGNGWP